MPWLHGDNSYCDMPPTEEDLRASPPAFFTGDREQAECGHGNTVYYKAEPGTEFGEEGA